MHVTTAEHAVRNLWTNCDDSSEHDRQALRIMVISRYHV